MTEKKSTTAATQPLTGDEEQPQTDEGAQDQQKDAAADPSEPQVGDEGFKTTTGAAEGLDDFIDDQGANAGGEVPGMVTNGDDDGERSTEPVHRVEAYQHGDLYGWTQTDAQGKIVGKGDPQYGSPAEAVAAAPSTFTSRNEVHDGEPTYKAGDTARS